MIIRDENGNSLGPATATGLLHERLLEENPENGNLAVTVGGMFIKQADADYYKFPITVRMTLSDLETLKTIAYNKTSRKFYTPRRPLKGESAIREIEIVFEEMPAVIEGKTFNNNIVEVTFLANEVL